MTKVKRAGAVEINNEKVKAFGSALEILGLEVSLARGTILDAINSGVLDVVSGDIASQLREYKSSLKTGYYFGIEILNAGERMDFWESVLDFLEMVDFWYMIETAAIKEEMPEKNIKKFLSGVNLFMTNTKVDAAKSVSAEGEFFIKCFEAEDFLAFVLKNYPTSGDTWGWFWNGPISDDLVRHRYALDFVDKMFELFNCLDAYLEWKDGTGDGSYSDYEEFLADFVYCSRELYDTIRALTNERTKIELPKLSMSKLGGNVGIASIVIENGKLSGSDSEILQNTIVSKFKEGEIKIALSNAGIATTGFDGKNLEMYVFNMIEWAQRRGVLVKVVNALKAYNPSFNIVLDTPSNSAFDQRGQTVGVQINTGGGAYVAKNITVGGDFIGGDKIG